MDTEASIHALQSLEDDHHQQSANIQHQILHTEDAETIPPQEHRNSALYADVHSQSFQQQQASPQQQYASPFGARPIGLSQRQASHSNISQSLPQHAPQFGDVPLQRRPPIHNAFQPQSYRSSQNIHSTSDVGVSPSSTEFWSPMSQDFPANARHAADYAPDRWFSGASSNQSDVEEPLMSVQLSNAGGLPDSPLEAQFATFPGGPSRSLVRLQPPPYAISRNHSYPNISSAVTLLPSFSVPRNATFSPQIPQRSSIRSVVTPQATTPYFSPPSSASRQSEFVGADASSSRPEVPLACITTLTPPIVQENWTQLGTHQQIPPSSAVSSTFGDIGAYQHFRSDTPKVIAVSSQNVMVVHFVEPLFGPAETAVRVQVVVKPHAPRVIHGFRIIFGDCAAATRVNGEEMLDSGDEHFDLIAFTPPLQPKSTVSQTLQASASVPVTLEALDQLQRPVDWADLGLFTYTDDCTENIPPRARELLVASSTNTFRSPSHSSSLALQPLSDAVSAIDVDAGGYPLATASTSKNISQLASHIRPSSSDSASSVAGSAMLLQDASKAMTSNGKRAKATPHRRSLSERKASRKSIDSVLAFDVSATQSSGALRHPPLPVGGEAPFLYRTAQLPSGNESTNELSDSKSKFTQVKVTFESDLDSMAIGWSHDEWRSKRRLVRFWRKQEGHHITAGFEPVLPQNSDSSHIVISCIFHESMNKCFVTSVDTIYLLEALVAVRFSVEEKNRIRRNLEGYRPLTVGKGKGDGDPFFQLIMEFPDPKPRNIEKDVKVFSWKDLQPAVEKIIEKYSVSFLAPQDIATGRPGLPPLPIGLRPGQSPCLKATIPVATLQDEIPRDSSEPVDLVPVCASSNDARSDMQH